MAENKSEMQLRAEAYQTWINGVGMLMACDIENRLQNGRWTPADALIIGMGEYRLRIIPCRTLVELTLGALTGFVKITVPQEALYRFSEADRKLFAIECVKKLAQIIYFPRTDAPILP